MKALMFLVMVLFGLGCSSTVLGPEADDLGMGLSEESAAGKVVAGVIVVNAKIFYYGEQFTSPDSVELRRVVNRRVIRWGARIKNGVARIVVGDGSPGPYQVRFLLQSVNFKGRKVWQEKGIWKNVLLPAVAEVFVELPVREPPRFLDGPFPSPGPAPIVSDKLPRGQRVWIPVEVKGIPDIVGTSAICAFDADITYDVKVLTPVRVVTENTLARNFMVVQNPRYQGKPIWRMAAVDFSLEGFREDGVLLYLEVDILPSAPRGITVLGFKLTLTNREADRETPIYFTKTFQVF